MKRNSKVEASTTASRGPSREPARSVEGTMGRDDMHGAWISRSQYSHRRRARRKSLLAFFSFALLVSVFIAGYALVWVPFQDGRDPFAGWFGRPTSAATPTAGAALTPTEDPATTESPTPTATVTPLPTSSALSPAERAALFEKLQKSLSAQIASKKTGRYAIYYMNPVSGETWGLNETAPFVAASSIKMGINTWLYDRAKAGVVAFDELLTYDSRHYPTGDYEAGTGIIQTQPNGTKYTIRETSGLSITKSDNCATNMVLRRLGGIDAVNAAYLLPIGGTIDYRKSVTYKDYTGTSRTGRHRTSAKDLALLASALYDRWSADPSFYQPLVDDLCATEFGFSLPNDLPEGVKVAHKIGTNANYATENDVGILFASEPFILCVMTETGSAAGAHAFTAQIAKEFYDFVETAVHGK